MAKRANNPNVYDPENVWAKPGDDTRADKSQPDAITMYVAGRMNMMLRSENPHYATLTGNYERDRATWLAKLETAQSALDAPSESKDKAERRKELAWRWAAVDHCLQILATITARYRWQARIAQDEQENPRGNKPCKR